MTRFKSVARALALATALTAIAAPAGAQQIERIVAFGDSYADTGNAFALGYSNPGAKQIYSSGRFSGGTNYIDTLAQLLGVPVENYAIGGALASINNTLLCFDQPFGATLCGDGFQFEVDQFLGVGPQSPVFPASDIALDQSDLVAISIGGNDARLFQQTGGTLGLAPLAGAATGAAAASQINRIVGTGTPTVSFIAGDTGRLPEIAADPAGAAVRSAFSTSFNQSLQPVLANLAGQGAIVHYLDLGLVLDQVIADPGAYGITKGIACPALPSTACVLDSSGYLFYLDGLHLTSQGFAIVGRYVAAQLAAPLTLQAPADIGVDVARQFGRTLDTRMDARSGAGAQGLRLFAVGDALSHRADESRGNESFRVTSAGVTLGADFGLGGGHAGIAANFSRPRAKFDDDSARVRGRSWQVGAYAGAEFGAAFVRAFAGLGRTKNRIAREGVVEGMDAGPRARHWLAGAKAGYLLPLGGVAVGPVAALDYAKARVKGYTEDGDPALALSVGRQSYASLRGAIGAELRGAAGTGDAVLRPYLTALLEKELSPDKRAVSFSQTSAPLIVNRFDFAPASKRAYGRLAAGGSAKVSEGLSLDARLTGTLGRKGDDETSGHFGVNLAF